MATTVADEPLKPAVKVSSAGWYALFLVSSAQAMSLLDRQILSILAPSIREDLQIGDAELGLLYGTVFSLFYALFSLPLGRLVDGWIRTRLLAICIAAWSIFAGLSAFASGFTLLAISRLGVGIGEGATQPAANSIIFDTFPREKRGTAMAALGIATALGLVGPVIAGPLSDWLTVRMGGRGRVWLTIFSLGVSPFAGIWTYSAVTESDFYLRFVVYSVILTLWLPPLYSLLYDIVLPRMRGITSSLFIIITTMLGLGMGPYFVGTVSDRNGGDLGQAIISINVVVPVLVVILFVILLRINRDETQVLDRARAGGEPV